MKKIKIKNLELGAIPRVVGIIDSPLSEAKLRGFIDRGVDMFELRVDLFHNTFDSVIDYIKKIKKSMSLPLIGTIRETEANHDDRVEWYIALSRYVDCIDMELGMPEWREVVHEVAGSAIVMVSEHDYKETPDFRRLGGIVRRAVSQGAGIVKIATMAKSYGDVTRLLRFTEDCETPLVSIAMGEIGKVSRLTAPLFGSLFTYGYLRKPTAPGQLSAPELAWTFDQYFPNRRKRRDKGRG